MIKVRIYHLGTSHWRAIVHDGQRWHRLDEWELDGSRPVPRDFWYGWGLPLRPMTYTLTTPELGCILVDAVEQINWSRRGE